MLLFAKDVATRVPILKKISENMKIKLKIPKNGRLSARGLKTLINKPKKMPKEASFSVISAIVAYILNTGLYKNDQAGLFLGNLLCVCAGLPSVGKTC